MLAQAATVRPARHDAPRAASAGFTLLELIVVLALLGVLGGLSVGFLQRRGDDIDIALASIRDQLRVAQLSASTRHQPSEVRIEPETENRPARVRARVLEPVGHWHMEDRPSLDDDIGLDTRLTGTVEPGRFGFARRPDVDGGGPLLRVATEGRARFDLSEGFVFRVDLWLDAREPMAVMRLGSSLELTIDEDLFVRARMVGSEGGNRTGSAIDLEAATPLRLGRWHELVLVHDGREFALQIDGRDADRAPLRDGLYQTDQDALVVSDGDEPVFGLVDSVALWAYALAAPQQLPTGVRIVAEPEQIHFDRHGDLEGDVRFALTAGEDTRFYTVDPGGVVAEIEP